MGRKSYARPCSVVSGAPALLLILALLSAMTGAARGGDQSGSYDVELWCVAKNNAPDSALQTALDWACGHGGTNCSPIQSGDPATTPPTSSPSPPSPSTIISSKTASPSRAATSPAPPPSPPSTPVTEAAFSHPAFQQATGPRKGGALKEQGVPPGFYVNEWGGAMGGRRASALSASASAAATMAVLLLTLYPS